MNADAIRDALHSGDYAAAARLFDRAASSARPEDLPELESLLRWARSAVLCARAHEEDRLRELHGELHALRAYRH